MIQYREKKADLAASVWDVGAVSATLLAVALMLSGCDAPGRYVSEPTENFDEDTRFVVVDRPYGFLLHMYYHRWNSQLEGIGIEKACRDTLGRVARSVAEDLNRQIIVRAEKAHFAYEEYLPGATSCTITTPVLFVKPPSAKKKKEEATPAFPNTAFPPSPGDEAAPPDAVSPSSPGGAAAPPDDAFPDAFIPGDIPSP